NSVELGAPGVNVFSTYKNGAYATLSGTSMATPHVTGAIALVRAEHPTWTYRQVIDQVLNTVDLVPSLSGKTITGGRLNLARALGAAAPVDTTGPRVTGAVFSGSTAGTINKLRVTFSEAMAGGSFTAADVS